MNAEIRISDLKRAYKKLNEKFKPVLVFHIGESAGFFSEYNCMILAMLYCLQHQIQFKLYSKDSNFGYEKGWCDYFEPFCSVTNNPIHRYMNMRSYALKEKLHFSDFRFLKWQLKKRFFNWVIQKLKLFLPFTYCTQDIWDSLFDSKIMNRNYYIPELNINGNLVQACNILVKITWNFNSQTEIEIETIINKLNLPQSYISCQIRGGDKYLEEKILPVDVYIERFEENKSINNIFVLTDDYAIVEQLEREKRWNIITLCDKKDSGYVHTAFRKCNKSLKREKIIKLLSSVVCCSRSSRFVGTKTSNPSIFLSILKPDISESIDYQINLMYYYLKN